MASLKDRWHEWQKSRFIKGLNDNPNPYQVLGLDANSTPAEINQAFNAKFNALAPRMSS